MKNLEIYIHIPFCVRQCEYCAFLSFPADDDAKLRYVKGLMAEMIFYGPLMKNYQVSVSYTHLQKRYVSCAEAHGWQV